MGTDPSGVARAGRTRPPTKRSHYRQPERQDDRKRGSPGYDSGKKVKGRKRHILVDTNGFILKVLVHPADVADSEGGKMLLHSLQQEFPRLAHLWADGGYFRTLGSAGVGLDGRGG